MKTWDKKPASIWHVCYRGHIDRSYKSTKNDVFHCHANTWKMFPLTDLSVYKLYKIRFKQVKMTECAHSVARIGDDDDVYQLY